MKKLLLILLCLPMIGFGQDTKLDEIVFSNGDTIFGKVIEVGVNDITYQHKGETTNNISKKRDIAKVIYSSGRVQTFDGLKVLEKQKRVLEKIQQPNSRFEEFQKSSHSIMLGLNTNFIRDRGNVDRSVIGFNLIYSYSLAFHPNWRYNSYFNYNYTYETLKLNQGFFTPADVDDPFLESPELIHGNSYNHFFIGQKIGHIHNEMFSTYIGSSIRIRTDMISWEFKFFHELEERFSFNKTHFIFLNIRAILFQPNLLMNSYSSGWFNVVEPTIGYGIKL